MEGKLVGPIEKAIEAAKLSKPPEGVYDGVDLRTLPRYICFRAALLKSNLTQQHVILILSAVLLVYYVATRAEVYSLYKQLRAKEYILAPGVQDFTPASPQSVSDSYVSNAVTDFIGLVGNVTAGNIDEQYAVLSEAMSPQLKVKFLAEAVDWKGKVKAEALTELLTVTEKEIKSAGNGLYQVTALARRDTYTNNEYLGHADEVVEMVLELIPPRSGKRWFLQINSLSRQSAESFRAKKSF